ncbi:hypothetical protein H0H93_000170 [Arthromyces matolae]|nr:hypothetical protein H0H93_000170 [Arthromyces matolae]
MTLLHDYFHLRNQQAFQRLLDGNADRSLSAAALSTSGSKSWTRPSPLASNSVCDVNARDWLGRTVLHLACSSPDTLEYVRILLRVPAINVNLADTESHWTPLHRALYHANIPAALLLLQRSDTDGSLKDLEGYTSFDLYNSTLNDTKPRKDSLFTELYTWGANKNAALGFADGGDRAHPDHVSVQKKDTDDDKTAFLLSRFLPIYVRQIRMSKLHTVVLTSESGGNLRLCGFGSGGRLGPGQHMQYSLKPFQHLTLSIVAVALGQDHTLALTKTGEVLSWGLNRFSQLGYVIENLGGESFGKIDEPVQASPRKIQGPLRKEVVKGIAASKTASVCWTNVDVYTWGTNNGQLDFEGYDKAAQPVQVIPRKATKVSQPVIDISISDSAMACLLETQDVICIWNDRSVRITFPGHSFPSEMQPYRPPQAVQDAKIAKITSCDETFAALTFSGELFTFSAANPSDPGAASKEKSGFKPQRVWALRKKFSSVEDVALGSDGSIIVCTESGHVFVRSRNVKSGQTSSGKAFKFQRLPALQRITQVCANSSGSFAALRAEYQLKPIEVIGNTFAEDLAEVQPFLRVRTIPGRSRRGSDILLQAPINPRNPSGAPHGRNDEDSDDVHVYTDVRKLQHILDILELQRSSPHGLDTESHSRFSHGGDVLIQVGSGFVFPAHQLILAARSKTLSRILSGSTKLSQGSKISLRLSLPLPHQQIPRLEVSGCQPITMLILLTFLYTDEVLAPWDHRVLKLLTPSKDLKVDLMKTKIELRALAEHLELHTLLAALESPIKSAPSSTLEESMRQLFEASQLRNNASRSLLSPDVILVLADRDVYCHSTILRARSEFFADFFDEEEWTKNRRDVHGLIHLDMKHHTWRIMEYVLKFLCFGAGGEMFESLEFASTLDEALSFMFDVMAAANELLLDRLVLLCSVVILQHVNVNNASFILADATHLHALQLIDRIQNFITVNLELFLETRILDDIPPFLVKQLGEYARQKQKEKAPISRSDFLVTEAMERHADWLAPQDFPVPLGRTSQSRKDPAYSKASRAGINVTPQPSPNLQPQRGLRHPPSNDDIFALDDIPSLPAPAVSPMNLGIVTASPAPTPVWKAASAPRVDMKVVMAEAANATATAPRRMQDAARDRGSPSHQSPINTLRSQKSTDLRQNNANQQPVAGPSTLRPLQTGWRTPADQVATHSSLPSTPSKDSRNTSAGSSSSPLFTSPLTPRRPPGTAAATTLPGLGPVITPTRHASSPSATANPSTRRTPGKAWSQTPTTPVQSTTGMSIVAIQQLEMDQLALDGAGKKDRRSLKEIQEEEQALQAEANFLAWWTAEEERIRLETQAAEAAAAGNKKGREGKHPGKAKADQGKDRVSQRSSGSHQHGKTGGAEGGGKRKSRKSDQKGAGTSGI